jgi:hypothetical protein
MINQYLASQIGHAPGSSYGQLQHAAFIPVKTGQDIQLFSPSSVYFFKSEGSNELYGSAFTFVDFGERANTFLRYCGVRSEPSVKGEQATTLPKLTSDVAWLLMREPERTLKQAGSKERRVRSVSPPEHTDGIDIYSSSGL